MKRRVGAFLGFLCSLAGCSDLGTAPPWEGWREETFAGYVSFHLPASAGMEKTTNPIHRGTVYGATWSMIWRYAPYNSEFVFSESWPGRPDIRYDVEKGVLLVDGRTADFVSSRTPVGAPIPAIAHLLWLRATGPGGYRLWITAQCSSPGGSDTAMTIFRSIRFIDESGSVFSETP